ncbi:hypothetical protein F5Y09DRAFT_269509 [Xylaria sp. FL1042]|nr:hypothetical protein F5Y09DRAFT_269509 [Xylaria sp. FL1042]
MIVPGDKNNQVITWLQSLTEEPLAEEPPTKRLRCGEHSENNTFVNPYNLPGSPLLTAMSDTSLKKRRLDEIDSTKPQTNVPIRRPRSPTKQRSNSPNNVKSKDALELLEKPVYVRGLDNFSLLPEDVGTLYSDLQRARHREEIIPYEVRSDVLARVGAAAARAHYFRTEPTAGAEALHAALCDIQLEAQVAQQHEYHEMGWNHLVHSPLLRLVFASKAVSCRTPSHQSTDKTAEGTQPRIQQRSVNVRVVPAMSVTIWGEYIPTKAAKKALDTSVLVAGSSDTGFSSRTSDSQSQACSVSEDAGTEQGLSGTDLYNQAYNHSDGKKVDYVLAIDPLGGTPLERVISFFIHNEAVARDLLPHVNQTLYRTLKGSPIACSIATKVEFQAQDPLLQLGIWIAAWHKRMYYLRRYILSESRLSASRAHDLLPSTLLIEVANHEWRLFFACDRSTSIEIYGPITIGSTRHLTEVYALVASLQAIKAWVETTFTNGMDQWLMCNELVKVAT